MSCNMRVIKQRKRTEKNSAVVANERYAQANKNEMHSFMPVTCSR